MIAITTSSSTRVNPRRFAFSVERDMETSTLAGMKRNETNEKPQMKTPETCRVENQEIMDFPCDSPSPTFNNIGVPALMSTL
jgi:hypothetical protein